MPRSNYGSFIDNTFQGERYHNAHARHCQTFTREEVFHRQYNEFEDSNLKRLLKKQELETSSKNHTPRYSQGNSMYTTRPPTGVDLALGLNGYDKLPAPSKAPRLPSSLQPLNDQDEMEKYRRRVMRHETSNERFHHMKQEVEARRIAEDEERRKKIEAVQQIKFKEESEKVREETTRQLNKAVVDDWKYQVDFKQKRQEDERLAETADALENKQMIESEDRREADQNHQAQTKNLMDRKAELSELDERRFMQDLEDVKEKNANTVRFGRITLDDKDRADKLEAEVYRQKQETKESLQSQINSNRARYENEVASNTERDRNSNSNNLEFIKEHKNHLATQKTNTATNDAEFQRYQNIINNDVKDQSRGRDAYFSTEARHDAHDKFDRSQRIAEERKQVVLHHNSLIQDQIRERATFVKREQELKRLEEENRLVAESDYRSKLLLEKEKKAQDQRSYRDYLMTQMEERRKIQMMERHRDKIFHEEQSTVANNWEKETMKEVGDVNVNEPHFLPKPVVPLKE